MGESWKFKKNGHLKLVAAKTIKTSKIWTWETLEGLENSENFEPWKK